MTDDFHELEDITAKSLEGRRTEIERTALWYLTRSGLGNHFVRSGLEIDFTKAEFEEITGFDFDPDRNAVSRSVYEFVTESVDELQEESDDVDELDTYCPKCGSVIGYETDPFRESFEVWADCPGCGEIQVEYYKP